MPPLLKTLGITLPIIQAPMAGVSTPAMAAAVSNAGALGSLGIGSSNVDQARKQITDTRALTQKPFQVNLFCHQPETPNPAKEARWLSYLAPHYARFDAKPPATIHAPYPSFLANPAMLDLLLELRPPIISFHFGLPPEGTLAKLRATGAALLATATNLQEAQAIAAAGLDAIVAQGFEAGGHRGCFNPNTPDQCLSMPELVRLLVKNINLPIIAAGGIMDGGDIAGALTLGASAAQLGTAFIACPESAVDPGYRAALFGPGAHETRMITAMSGRPARCLGNKMTQLDQQTDPTLIPDYPIAYEAGKLLNVAAKAKGELGFGGQWAGQGAPKARALPAGELVMLLHQESMAEITREDDEGPRLTRDQTNELLGAISHLFIVIEPQTWYRMIDDPPNNVDEFVAALLHEEKVQGSILPSHADQEEIRRIVRIHFEQAGIFM